MFLKTYLIVDFFLFAVYPPLLAFQIWLRVLLEPPPIHYTWSSLKRERCVSPPLLLPYCARVLFCGGALLQSVTRAKPTALLVASLPSLSPSPLVLSWFYPILSNDGACRVNLQYHPLRTRGKGCRSFHKLWFRTENQGERLLDDCKGGAYHLGRDNWDAQSRYMKQMLTFPFTLWMFDCLE